MAATTSYGGENHGIQVAQNYAPITVNLESSSDQACLRDLRTTNPYDDKSRIQNTNGGLLKDSYRWILENNQFKQWQESQNNRQNNRLLWVRGDPGKGKTMLMCGIIDELTRLHGSDAHSHISFFFCQATDDRINNAIALIRGLIYLLVRKSPALLSHVRCRYDEAGKALFEDTNAWSALSTVFTDILNDPALNNAYIIIDALDECTNGRRSLLDLIVQQSSTHSKIKWIVSSRNWPDIIERLDIASQVAPISLELNEMSVSEAVEKFIQHKVESLATVKRYKKSTCAKIYDHLLLNSQGTFLWVALVCQNLDRTLPRHAIKKLEAFPPGLDDLYSRMIDQVRWSEDAELCKQILGIISMVYRPITLSELTSLIKLPNSDGDGDYDEDDDHEALSEIIAVCGSFLTLQEDTITFVHQSAKDFLLQEALEEIVPRGTGAEHYMIFFTVPRRDVQNTST
ncbi:hypothetical protein N7454_000179 [Penicillium verhagenii]|nr:hypothetical protein N7454_000179 [Penicillium verhagenii]